MRKPMDDPNNTTDTLDQTAEELLTHTVSDEALEAAAGTERELQITRGSTNVILGCLLC
jgi:hypothetical protein